MSVNKYRPHILVLPEDEATRQMANGFYQNIPDQRYTQILPVAGGCDHVVDCFKSDYMSSMEAYENRHFVLVIDFDKRPNRLQHIKTQIDQRIMSRVFILGAFLEAEDLRRSVGENLETIGLLLAQDCQNQTMNTWKTPLFDHLQDEIERARLTLRPLIFS
jgi:hypothetical protein